MSLQVDEWFYIACRDIPLRKGTWQEIKDRVLPNQSPEHLLKGELLVIEGDGTRDVVRGKMALDHTKKFECPIDDVAYVTSVEYRILAPIKSPGERWDSFKDKQRMKRLKDLRVDEQIWITLPIGKDSKSGLIGSSYLRSTIRYIGDIHQEIGTYFGIELPDPKGTCDGSFKECRYFICADKHGIFLPASHLNLPKSKPASSKGPRGEVVLPLVKSKSGQEFCKDDKVFVFDKNGKRISGKVKWAYCVKNIMDYVIGIETDSSDTSYHKFPDHVPNCSHLFKEYDRKRHSYLALPETVVIKIGPEGTSVDKPTRSSSEGEYFEVPADEHDLCKPLQNNVSEVATQQEVSTKLLLDEQIMVMEEAQKNKDRGIAKEFGHFAVELKEQKEAVKKLTQEQEISNQNQQYQNSSAQQGRQFGLPGTSVLERSDDSLDYRRKSDEDILRGRDYPNISQDTFKREQSEGHSPHVHLHRNRHPVPSLSVGSLVEVSVGEKNVCGTFRWTGTFPGVKEPIAGVELNEWRPDCGDGTWRGVEYFRCKHGHGMFVVMSKLKPYPRQRHLPRDAKFSCIPGNNSADSEVKDLVQELRHECKDLLHQHKQLQEDQQNLKLGQEELEIENQQIKEDYQQLIAEHRQLQKANNGIQATLDQTTTRLEQTTAELEQTTVRLEQTTAGLEQTTAELEQTTVRLEQTTAGLEQTTETLQTAMQKITQLEKTVLDMQPSWSIDPTELRMTDERIGGGGWGVVKAGLYHGTKVAVKEIYDIIVSDYNRATFQREMRIASLVRHPNLLLFLGAVTSGNLQIVTELMETTLRKVMEKGRLTPEGISPIAKHVACALNYLHSRPDPIIHRDVSSANVLLSSRQKGWVAKLGDFGSANFLNRTNTKIPGAQLYSAPEAIDPSFGPQGPKMDTYSFGVLLLEMCVCRLPEPAVLRGAASDVPQWPQPKRLIGELALRCIIQDLEQRPYMAAVVNQL